MVEQTNAASPTPAAERLSETAHVYQEGIVAGIAGAAVIALWFLALDVIQGRPLYTPTVLGTALFKGPGALDPEAVSVSLETVLVFTWVHVLVFCFLGGIASYLITKAERSPNLGFGVLLLFVVFEFGFIAVTMVFAEPVLKALAWPAVLVGNLLAAAAMGLYLWRRHPQLRIEP
jgi:hypothetical protein